MVYTLTTKSEEAPHFFVRVHVHMVRVFNCIIRLYNQILAI